MKLLLVEDDELLGSSLKKGLHEAGYVLDWARDGEDGAYLLCTGSYDGVILDWMLPRRSGLEILQRHRQSGKRTPILMLTARDTTDDLVTGLDAGADDYVVKPFEFEELLARLRVLVRRRHDRASSLIRIDDLHIDIGRREAQRGGHLVELTAREFALLELLALRANQVVTRQEIWDTLYATDDDGTSNVVDVYISYLRRKIDRGRKPLIVTRRGQGYMLCGDQADIPFDAGS